jgi:hypothetical protein
MEIISLDGCRVFNIRMSENGSCFRVEEEAIILPEGGRRNEGVFFADKIELTPERVKFYNGVYLVKQGGRPDIK